MGLEMWACLSEFLKFMQNKAIKCFNLFILNVVPHII